MAGGGHGPPLFVRSKKKKIRQRQKGKGFKTETIKRLSPRSKYYCLSHSRASRIWKFFLSVNHGGWQYFPVFHSPPTLKSISPALSSKWHLLRFSPRWKLVLVTVSVNIQSKFFIVAFISGIKIHNETSVESFLSKIASFS